MESKDASNGGEEHRSQTIFCIYAKPDDDLYYRELKIALMSYPEC